MDGNRDLQIDFGSTNDNHCTFWLNDDYDVEYWLGRIHTFGGSTNGWAEDDDEIWANWTKNCNDNFIGRKAKDVNGMPPDSENHCLRDLEDFTVVQLKVPGVLSNLTGVTYWLQFANCTSGNPSVNLFRAVTNGVTGPFDYLTNMVVATNQVLETRACTVGTSWQQITTNYIDRYDQPIGFLLEGKTAGKGDLTFMVKKGGTELCRSSISLDLHPITEFYDTYHVGLVEYQRVWINRWLGTWSKTKWEVEVQPNAVQVQTNVAYQARSDQYLLLVHGWNMTADDKLYFTQAAFKRLWWQKYKGGFGLFDWPTFSDVSLWQAFYEARAAAHNFDDSEMIGWLCGTSLARLMENLNASGQLRLWVHSLGNIVAGEAIHKYNGTYPIKTYIASQAAISGHAYCQDVTPLPSFAPETPRIFPYWYTGDVTTTNRPYLESNTNKVTRMCNYFNPHDWVLDIWKFNTKTKPDDIIGYGFRYGGNTNSYNDSADMTNRFYRVPRIGATESFQVGTTNLQERYAVFAYCLQSWCMPLGQAVNQAFSGTNLDLEADSLLKYDNEYYSHSKEFRSNIIDQEPYYEHIITDCQF